MVFQKGNKLGNSNKGKTPWNKGKPHSKKTRDNIKKSLVGKNIGSNNHSWKGGISKENHLIRNSAKYIEWRLSVFKRDNFICQGCGQVGVNLNAHHIKHFATHKKLRFNINNGVTLCEECHKQIHKTN